MANLKLTSTVRSALATALLTIFDAGAGPCTLKFYTGAQPAGPLTAVTTQTLLGTATCSDPVGTVAAGVLTFGAIAQDASADASGTATWARLFDGDGTPLGDFDITNNAGNGLIKMNTTTIVEGGPIQVSAFTFSIGGA